jgi:hypothetical protein
MIVRDLLVEDEPVADELPADDDQSPLLGFHWEFSDAESERFGEAILSAISDDLESQGTA